MARKARQSQFDECIAKARHDDIALERKEADKALKEELSVMSSNAKHFEKDCKAAIRELPKDERPAAREELKEDVHKRRHVEMELRKEILKDEIDNSFLSRKKDRDTHPDAAVEVAGAVNGSSSPLATEIRNDALESEIDDLKQAVVDNGLEAHSDIVAGEEAVLKAHKEGNVPDAELTVEAVVVTGTVEKA